MFEVDKVKNVSIKYATKALLGQLNGIGEVNIKQTKID